MYDYNVSYSQLVSSSFPQVTDTGLQHLSRCTKLTRICVSGSGITSDGAKRFASEKRPEALKVSHGGQLIERRRRSQGREKKKRERTNVPAAAD